MSPIFKIIPFVILVLFAGFKNPEGQTLNPKTGVCFFYGKIKVNFMGQPVDPEGIQLCFSENGAGPVFAVGHDGRFKAMATTQDNYISVIWFQASPFKTRFTTFKPHSLLIMPLEPLKSYFIGDLTFNLDYETSNKKPNGGAIVVGAALGGVVGAIVAKEITSEHNVDKPEYQICPKIDSLSLYEHDYLKIRYPHITEIIYNPVVCQ